MNRIKYLMKWFPNNLVDLKMNLLLGCGYKGNALIWKHIGDIMECIPSKL